ncbi:MAG: ABC transporter ATP-binding protein [Clostridiales bacterium]|nr:ABC transporter ATP-binding protein [Clostridiales bacterium]
MGEVLTLDHVCKTFGKRPVVKDISFTVQEGEVFGFLGPNGAGKTTTIKMILGLLSVDSGSIRVAGHDVETDFEAAMSHISGIVENPDMYPYLSGYENLMLQARAAGADEAKVEEAIHLVGMQQRIREKFRTYSLGMKQRLGIAQALLRNPKIMILDEPTNGLDPAGIKEMRDLLRTLAHERGMSVLVSSHILQEMQLMCDTVGIIGNGELLRVSSMEELTRTAGAGLYRYTLRPMEQAADLIRQHYSDRIAALDAGVADLRLSEEEIPAFNRLLMENGVTIYGLNVASQSLEQSFMELTGGGNVIG